MILTVTDDDGDDDEKEDGDDDDDDDKNDWYVTQALRHSVSSSSFKVYGM